MRSRFIAIIFLFPFLINSCAGGKSESNSPLLSPTLTFLPDEETTDEETIRFLENRVKADPDDMISYNLLGTRYLKRLRETGNLNYLTLADKTAKESLRVFPPEKNINALSLMASINYASHEFTTSQDQAIQLLEIGNDHIFAYQMLGDSLLELGEYEKATAAFKKLENLGKNSPNGKFILEIRLARIERLNGNNAKAETALLEALSLIPSMRAPSREIIAWSYSQLAEYYFSIGDYNKSEINYNEALKIFPNYFVAVAGLGQAKAAQGQLDEAIKQYKQAVEIVPDLNFVATLGDIYKLAGKEKEAEQQYQLVEQIAKLSTLNGVLYNRALALFYANHDIKIAEAYDQAQKEYQNRKDIYGADALAWTALKAGKIPEAQEVIKEALKLGTKDAKIFYHAGMIAFLAGDKKAAQDYIERALTLNPQFDPLQSIKAQKTLKELKDLQSLSKN